MLKLGIIFKNKLAGRVIAITSRTDKNNKLNLSDKIIDIL